MKPIIHQITLRIPYSKYQQDIFIKQQAAKKLKLAVTDITEIRILRKSLDARKKPIVWVTNIAIAVNGKLPQELPSAPFTLQQVTANSREVYIIGAGPAGLFAALEVLSLGGKPIIFERGKDVSSRRFDLAPILRKGQVNSESNYCFGEGGAGTFSDGKLYTRTKNKAAVQKIYRTFVKHGAATDILIEAHPHIGSNLLPNIIRSIRQEIIELGGEVHFESKLIDLQYNPQGIQEITVLQQSQVEKKKYNCQHLILATGHSARDIYHLLDNKKIPLMSKTFAVGMRIEHSQPLIDSIQYSYRYGKSRPLALPAARYRLATNIAGRGVYSFCMCPGGFIVPASTDSNHLVLNGMSLSRRDSPFANSGLVAEVHPADLTNYQQKHGALAGIYFQRDLEVAAWQAGGEKQRAPGQLAIDFVAKRASKQLPETSYFPGTTAARLDQILPEFISNAISLSLQHFAKNMPTYLNKEAQLLGFETRTSSAVKIPRNADLQHPSVSGLYPCGEGAGYAGGIVSSALDGMRCAQTAMQQ